MFVLDEGDTGEAILACPNDEHRLDTCHVCVGSGIVEDFDGYELCTRCAGRGHFHEANKVNGKGVHADRDSSEAPRTETPSTGLPATRDAESSVPSLKEIRTEWGVMFNDGSVLLEYNGRTAQRRAAAAAEKIAARYYPDNIRLVSRPVYAGEWVES